MDYRYLRWQVIDTPGLLDRPLEDRNTIEMQVCVFVCGGVCTITCTGVCVGVCIGVYWCVLVCIGVYWCNTTVHTHTITNPTSLHTPPPPLTHHHPSHSQQSITALAHLRAAVLYIVDISEECGYTIAQQAALFDSIKPLFANKPVLIVANKVDRTPLDGLKAEDAAILQSMVNEAVKVSHGGRLEPGEHGQLYSMSTLTEIGVMDVRNTACDQLLSSRVEQKVHKTLYIYVVEVVCFCVMHKHIYTTVAWVASDCTHTQTHVLTHIQTCVYTKTNMPTRTHVLTNTHTHKQIPLSGTRQAHQ